MTQENELFNAIVADLDSGKLILPTLPDVAIQVRKIVDNPDATAQQLADIIATDAALSTRLLKIANSALYRGRTPVESIQTAVARLGLTLIRNLVTSLVLQKLFKPQQPQLEKRMREAWEHSIQVAAISQVIAAKQPMLRTDEAMLAGLIHAIGVLPILTKIAEVNPQLLDNKVLLDKLVENLHPKIGQIILERWEFSENLIAVPVGYLNLLRNTHSTTPDLVDVVQVAYLQSQKASEKNIPLQTLEHVKAYQKLGIELGISVAELDENSAEYAEALALFTHQ